MSLEGDSSALVEHLGLFGSKDHGPDTGLRSARRRGIRVRTPVNLDAVIARAQSGDHPIKAVRTQGCLIEGEVAAVDRIERGARSSNRLEQVRADLDVAILVRDWNAWGHGRGGLTAKRRNRDVEVHSGLRGAGAVFRVHGHIRQEADYSRGPDDQHVSVSAGYFQRGLQGGHGRAGAQQAAGVSTGV